MYNQIIVGSVNVNSSIKTTNVTVNNVIKVTYNLTEAVNVTINNITVLINGTQPTYMVAPLINTTVLITANGYAAQNYTIVPTALFETVLYVNMIKYNLISLLLLDVNNSTVMNDGLIATYNG